MKFKIPEDEAVRKAINEILGEHSEVPSQESFHSMVQSRLRLGEKKYRLSPKRLRRIAASMKDVGVRVMKMRSRHEPKVCYICGGELTIRESVNLFGDKTVIGKKCKKCGFEIGKEKLAPRRYIFYGK